MDPVARARQFFQQNGRDIDRARFDFHFGALPLGALLAILSQYQNPDGGFGRALEVDIKAPDSNPFATELALVVCLQAGVGRDHPLLARAVAYLEQTQDEDGGWRLSPAIYTHELAPWFQAWQWPSLGPACSLAGLLRSLGLGSDSLHARVAALFDRLGRPADLIGDEFYAVRPYAYYFLPEWSHPQRELYLSGVLWWLVRQHLTGHIQDAAHFFEFVRAPVTYVGSRLPAGILTEELDSLAASQAEDGGWPTPYDAGWRGWATVQNLLVLRAFGRI
jgi:hypothetical protein